jgi:hypothetical protein
VEAVSNVLNLQQHLLHAGAGCWQDAELVWHAAMHTARVAQTLLRYVGWLAAALVSHLQAQEQIPPSLLLAWRSASDIFGRCEGPLLAHGGRFVSVWGPPLNEQLSRPVFEGGVPGEQAAAGQYAASPHKYTHHPQHATWSDLR